MKRSVEVWSGVNTPAPDVQLILSEAPKWWSDRVLEIRKANTEAEVRTICSRSANPFQKAAVVVKRTAKRFSDLSELAWKKFVSRYPTPEAFRAVHPELAPADDSRERRRQLFDLIS